VRVQLPDPALRADLRDFLHRWGCVTYEVNDDTIEVTVPDAPAERQGRRELDLYLETWREHHLGLELASADPSGSRLSQRTFATRSPNRCASLRGCKPGLACGVRNETRRNWVAWSTGRNL
jgi:hypothetical protein